MCQLAQTAQFAIANYPQQQKIVNMSKHKQHRYSLRDNRQDRKIERLIKFINAQSPIRQKTKNKSQKVVTQVDLPKSKSPNHKPILNQAIHAFLEKRIEINLVKTQEKKTKKQDFFKQGTHKLIGKTQTQQKILPLIHILKTQEAIDLKKQDQNKKSLLLKCRKFESLFPKQIKHHQKTCSIIHHLPFFETQSLRSSDGNRKTQKSLQKDIKTKQNDKNYDGWQIMEQQKLFHPQIQFHNW